MAAVLAVTAVSSGSLAASSWSGNATEWIGCVKGAPAKCVQQCVVDTKGNVTSSGIWECVQECHDKGAGLRLAGRIGSIASGVTGLLRYAPWIVKRISQGRCLEKFLPPDCVLWAHSTSRARWEEVITGVSMVLSAVSFGSIFSSGVPLDAIKCVGYASSIWNSGIVIHEFITTWNYRRKNSASQAATLDQILTRMEVSLGVGGNVVKNDKNVDWKVFNSIRDELTALSENSRTINGQDMLDRLPAVEQKLAEWRGV